MEAGFRDRWDGFRERVPPVTATGPRHEGAGSRTIQPPSVVMGTVGPELVDTAAVDFVDAPVSGSVSMAETAAITTMVGGSWEQFERIRPVLAAMTSAQLHTGSVGAGWAAKLAVNAVLAALSQGVAEGLLIAEAGDLDPTVSYDVLRNSAAGAPYVGYKEEAYLSPETTGVAARL